MKLLVLAALTAGAVCAQSRGHLGSSGPGAPPVAPRQPFAAPAPLVPYALFGGRPVYILGYGYYPAPFHYDSGYAPPAADASPPPPQSPDVIVNPDFKPDTTNSTMHVYTYTPSEPGNGQAAEPAAPQVYFLIAMKDHTIVAALAYWVENGTLNYIDRQGVRYQAALDAVDREFSAQLNKDRNIDFALPAQ